MESTNEDEVQHYSCGVCHIKNLIPNKENEVDHECLNGLSIIIDENFVLYPHTHHTIVGSKSNKNTPNHNKESITEEIHECHEANNYNSIRHQNFILKKSGNKKRSKLLTIENVWTSERVAHLIQLVHDNEIIWNYYIPMKERSKLQVGIAWDVIVDDLKNIFPDVSSNFNSIAVQSKWKGLVDYFWRKVASHPKTTGSATAASEAWPYFKNMAFLQEIQNNQKTIDNFSDEDKENRANEKVRKKRSIKNNNIEQIASAIIELAKAQQIVPPPPLILAQNLMSTLTSKEKKIRNFVQLMESLMQDIPDSDLDNVFFSIHEIVHKTKK